ncbi:MAG: alpha-galactosidase [Roseburia sp.]|nr:alpha-galactosidase [Roseburia sp.]MCM1099406.1 alpha-galactosidase [Ruminococcus flavefaciens]
MNIVYDEKTRIFKLDTAHTSYLIGIVDEEGFIGHAYYGKRISDGGAAYLMRIGEPPFVPSRNNRDRSSFFDAFPMEFPGCNTGDYRESAIEVMDGNGHNAAEIVYRGHRIYNGKPALPGLPATFGGERECMTLEIDGEDRILGMEITLRYSIFEDVDVIARSVSVKNASQDSFFLTRLMSASLDMDSEDYRLLTLHGSWARERRMELREIGYGKTGVGSTRGESSHQEHPFLALVAGKADQEQGSVYGVHFVYSGNFLAQVEKTQFDSLRVQMGIHPRNFRYQVRPGEVFQAPEVILTYSDQGLGGMTRTLHDLYRKHLLRSPYRNQKRPILINNWEATYFQFNTEKLLDIAREAKRAGIEMLVMDDGWFGCRNDDNTSLGDWKVNEEKLPGGLKYLVDQVNGIGLKFGIWFEPEMVSPDSELYRAHPDWAIAIPNRIPCRSRNQYVLDLTRREVLEYVYQAVAEVLRSANIEYVKWDMNRQLTDLGSLYLGRENQGELSHRYVLAVYELQERLTREFPKLLLENCSGGGARFDPGMLYYSPQIWCSDDTDAIERLAIQEGTALIYPLSAIGAHVADCPNHTVGRNTPFSTRGNVALAGTFGYELDITRISEEDRAQIPRQVALYHKYNDLIREGDYYRIASYRENHFYDCWAVVSKDKKEALVTYVQVMRRPNCHSRMLKLAGLEAGMHYRVCRETEAAEETELICCGDTLMNAGIPIPEMWGDFQSVLIHLTAEESGL